MAKYIDADKLAIDLQHRCDALCPYTKAQRDVMCRACLLGDAIDTVEDQPAVDIEPRWIPVTERLPEEHEEVLTSDSVFGITFDSLHNGKWRKHPVAWMPLPEPYKGGEKE